MLGPHIGRGKTTLVDECRRCEQFALAQCCQFYAHGPRGSRCLIGGPEAKLLRETTVVKIIHASLTCLPLSRPEKFSSVLVELETGRRVGAHGLVVHLKNGWRPHLAEFMSFLDERAKDDWPILFLENHAAKSNESTLDSKETIDFLVSVVAHRKTRVGLCIDTAHLWGNGVELRTRDDARRFLDWIPDEVLPVMFHLNDSIAVRGSGYDRHGPVGDGVIWSDLIHSGKERVATCLRDPSKKIRFEETGAAEFMDFARQRDLIVILESGATEEAIKYFYR